MKISTRACLVSIALIGVIAGLPSPARAAIEDDLERLIAAGKNDEAYQLAQRNGNRLGQRRFDFLYGAAAVQSGRAARGVLALERVVQADPQHHAARLALARGYFLIGDDLRAREEFQRVLNTKGVPEAARQVATEHLAAITQREAKSKSVMQFFAEVGYGYDSNVASGVSNANINIPVFGDVTIDPSGVKRGDRVTQVTLGYKSSGPLAGGWSVYSAAELQVRRNAHERDFDQNSFSSIAGLAKSEGAAITRLGLFGNVQTLSDRLYRSSIGPLTEYTRQFSPTTQGNAAFAVSRITYAHENAVRNSYLSSGSASIRHRLPGSATPEIEAGVTLGRELARASDRQELSRDIKGVRVGFNMTPTPSMSIGGSASWLASDYLADDPVLLTTRRDRLAGYDLYANWQLRPQWSLRAELSEQENRSNISLYSFDRWQALVRLRHYFK